MTNQNTYKHDVTLWYEVFNTKDPAVLNRILSDKWIDIPPAPNQPPGPEGVKQILVQLTTAFPDLKVTIQDMIQDGNKVVVRSEITGTHKAAFIGFPAKNGKLAIQAIDIREFRDGKIARTWHSEDWLTGLHQLGAFEK